MAIMDLIQSTVLNMADCETRIQSLESSSKKTAIIYVGYTNGQ